MNEVKEASLVVKIINIEGLAFQNGPAHLFENGGVTPFK
jgi:hypothetical protein